MGTVDDWHLRPARRGPSQSQAWARAHVAPNVLAAADDLAKHLPGAGVGVSFSLLVAYVAAGVCAEEGLVP